MVKRTKYNLYLLLAAAIWGFAFVAQRFASMSVGPFTFNGIRFALGSVVVLPFMVRAVRNKANDVNKEQTLKSGIIPGLIAGSALFAASALQQIGIAYTTAGKAAFITGLYIVLVPVAGIFLKHTVHLKTWLSIFLAVIGLYLLTMQGFFTIGKGDLVELAGAFVWTAHILLIDRFVKRVEVYTLAFFQFVACSVFSFIAALLFEKIAFSGIMEAAVPILYGGMLSVGVAYTLQVIGQKHALPSHAAVILSMESVFASIGGLLILSEHFGIKEYFGCAFMLAGILLAQMPKGVLNRKRQT